MTDRRIGRWENRGFLNGLQGWIRIPSRCIRMGMVMSLGLVACHSTTDLARTLKNGTQVEQMEALIELSETGEKDRETRQLLIASAKGALSPLVRSSAVRLMAREPRQEEYFDPILLAIDDSSFVVRFEAVRALGLTGRSEAVDPLIRKLKDDDHPWVRFKAARSLGRLKDRRALPGLIRALDDENETVQVNAFLALKRLTGEDHGRDADGWRAFTD